MLKVVDDLDALAQDIPLVREAVANVTRALCLQSHDDDGFAAGSSETNVSDANPFFRDLYESFKRNHALSKNAHRYSDDLKRFAAYVYIIGGRLTYETLSANLPLPSASTALRVLHNEFPPVEEGVIRAKELKAYLEKQGLPLSVWISEDGTRITGRVQYDTASNQMVGLVLPLHPETGMPINGQFVVNSAEDIANHFANGQIAHYAYVIMAQPLREQAAPFCLCMFGTDNVFKAEDVVHRFVHYLIVYNIYIDSFFL